MSRKLRLGVVGTGNIFRSAHLPAWLEHPEIEVVALCDVVQERAQKLADEHGIAHVYTDYRELLRHGDIDAVDICTPNLYHSEVAVAALMAGIHVFCEKPDAVTPEKAQEMAEAAAASGKVLMTMRNNRFTPASQYLKRYINEGHMGEIYTGRCGWLRRRGIPGKGGWFTTKELSGGGPLIDLGVHYIDLALWMMGNPKPVAVSGATYCKFAGTDLSDSEHSQFGEKKEESTFNVEDLATGFIRFDNNATLQIEFSWASNVQEEGTFLELRGTKAGASLVKGELKLFGEMAGHLVNIQPIMGNRTVDAHGEHIKHFVQVVQGREDPILIPQHGIDMIKILTALYQSAELGAEVRL